MRCTRGGGCGGGQCKAPVRSAAARPPVASLHWKCQGGGAFQVPIAQAGWGRRGISRPSFFFTPPCSAAGDCRQPALTSSCAFPVSPRPQVRRTRATPFDARCPLPTARFLAAATLAATVCLALVTILSFWTSIRILVSCRSFGSVTIFPDRLPTAFCCDSATSELHPSERRLPTLEHG